MYLKSKVKGFMGKCKFCGRDAGFFSSQHSECVQKHSKGLESIVRDTVTFLRFPALVSDKEISEFKEKSRRSARASFVSTSNWRRCVLEGWEKAANTALEKDRFSAAAGQALLLFANRLALAKVTDLQHSILRTLEKTTLQRGLKRIVSTIDGWRAGSPITATNADESKRIIESIAKAANGSETDFRKHVVESWDQAVSNAVRREILLESAANILIHFAEQFELGKTDADSCSSWIKLENRIASEVQVWSQKQKKCEAIIDALKAGVPIQLVVSKQVHPFKLQKSETLVWTFSKASYFEQTKVKSFQSLHSIRSATEYRMQYKDIGTMGLTTKHIYFVGATEVFRIRYDRIGNYGRHQDGIIVTRYATKARPQLFTTGEEFTYNLVTALARAY